MPPKITPERGTLSIDELIGRELEKFVPKDSLPLWKQILTADRNTNPTSIVDAYRKQMAALESLRKVEMPFSASRLEKLRNQILMSGWVVQGKTPDAVGNTPLSESRLASMRERLQEIQYDFLFDTLIPMRSLTRDLRRPDEVWSVHLVLDRTGGITTAKMNLDFRNIGNGKTVRAVVDSQGNLLDYNVKGKLNASQRQALDGYFSSPRNQAAYRAWHAKNRYLTDLATGLGKAPLIRELAYAIETGWGQPVAGVHMTRLIISKNADGTFSFSHRDGNFRREGETIVDVFYRPESKSEKVPSRFEYMIQTSAPMDAEIREIFDYMQETLNGGIPPLIKNT